ncbi:MAG: hypothetical protein QOJ73_7535, partial [Streptosporangiaceae bacterium]|nr:hypothetical protein [Streptosporangiaceae bacterium]
LQAANSGLLLKPESGPVDDGLGDHDPAAERT